MSNVTYLILANPKFEMTPSINTSIKGSLKGKGTITTTQVAQMNFPFPRKVVIDNISIKVIGIDLGTSRCCAAVNRKNGISTVQLDNTGERLLPSYVAYDEEIVKCGKVVVNRLRNYAKSTVFDSKRIIGRSLNDVEIDSNWPFRISKNENKVVMELKKCGIGVQISAEEVAADLLKHIKQKSEDFQGTKMTDVVITIPAAFTEAQKTATIEAAKLAGWEKIELLHEPIAAAFAYFIEKHIPHKSNVLVFDLGGGTLDVCIFKIENNQILILSNTGDTKLGGRDFDTVLFNYFLNQLGTKHDISLIKDKKYKLILDCQRIKEDLSAVASCILNVDEYEPNMHEIIDISRNEFQSLTKPLLNRIKNTIHSALHESKFDEKEIDKILLVGGGSRMPMIKTLLKKIFPRAEQCCAEHPDEVVAIGAAYYAYSISS
uniref:Heat shock protein 70 n=1 Tax=Panagrolaimus sp. ES5 TaxID=591445 RepID=A0AC34F552_9BILA